MPFDDDDNEVRDLAALAMGGSKAKLRARAAWCEKHLTLRESDAWLERQCFGKDEWSMAPEEKRMDKTVYEIPYTGFSDYSGSMVERANLKYFLERYDDKIKHVIGGHGSEWGMILKVNLNMWNDDDWECFTDDVEGLENYPLIDEDLHSQMEQEAYDEGWNSWAKDDFKKEVWKVIQDEVEQCKDPETFEAWFDAWFETDEVRVFFEDLREEANEYWEIEEGGSAWIRVDDIVENGVKEGTVSFAALYRKCRPEDPRQTKFGFDADVAEALVEHVLSEEGEDLRDLASSAVKTGRYTHAQVDGLLDEIRREAVKNMYRCMTTLHAENRWFVMDMFLAGQTSAAKASIEPFTASVLAKIEQSGGRVLDCSKSGEHARTVEAKWPAELGREGTVPSPFDEAQVGQMEEPAMRWHIVWPDGRILQHSELWERPKDALPDNGDPMTPWYETEEHFHGKFHPWSGSYHLRALDAQQAVEKAKSRPDVKVTDDIQEAVENDVGDLAKAALSAGRVSRDEAISKFKDFIFSMCQKGYGWWDEDYHLKKAPERAAEFSRLVNVEEQHETVTRRLTEPDSGLIQNQDELEAYVHELADKAGARVRRYEGRHPLDEECNMGAEFELTWVVKPHLESVKDVKEAGDDEVKGLVKSALNLGRVSKRIVPTLRNCFLRGVQNMGYNVLLVTEEPSLKFKATYAVNIVERQPGHVMHATLDELQASIRSLAREHHAVAEEFVDSRDPEDELGLLALYFEVTWKLTPEKLKESEEDDLRSLVKAAAFDHRVTEPQAVEKFGRFVKDMGSQRYGSFGQELAAAIDEKVFSVYTEADENPPPHEQSRDEFKKMVELIARRHGAAVRDFESVFADGFHSADFELVWRLKPVEESEDEDEVRQLVNLALGGHYHVSQDDIKRSIRVFDSRLTSYGYNADYVHQPAGDCYSLSVFAVQRQDVQFEDRSIQTDDALIELINSAASEAKASVHGLEVFYDGDEVAGVPDDHDYVRGAEFELRFRIKHQVSEAQLLEHKYSSTQINLPENLEKKIMEWSQKNIQLEDLFVEKDSDDKGRETNLHVTVKYGLEAETPSEALVSIAKETLPFKVALGTISLFEQEDHDVVKLDVTSPGLRALNAKVSAACPNGDTYPDYKPHMTLAYVKKGCGDRLVGHSPFESEVKMGTSTIHKEGLFDAVELIFSSSDESKGWIVLPFGGQDA